MLATLAFYNSILRYKVLSNLTDNFMKNYPNCKKYREKKTFKTPWATDRKFLFALLVICISFFNGYLLKAQTSGITISLSNVSIKDALKAIEKQSDFSFVYNSKVVDVSKTVTIDIADKPIIEVLDKLFTNTDVAYVIVNKQIVLSNKNEPSVPSKKITGTITDEKGEALIGAAVRVKGAIISTITNINGQYALEVPGDAATLVYSYVGYKSAEMEISDRSEISVSLSPDITSLSEVVVVGYGSMKKKDLTGSIVSVDSKELKSLPVPSVGDALQGRASGVQIVSQGSPGSDPVFIIRGLSSINDSKPLFVIDGIPTTSGLNQLNPDDIESIQVLKDASAAAIYGSRGANGVIIITTKRGKGETGHLNFNSFYATQQPTNMIEMLNAAEYAQYSNDMLSNGGRPTNPEWADPSTLGTGTDWLDELIKKNSVLNSAPMKSVSLSYSTNSEKSNMYASGNYLNQDGIVLNTNYKRYTIQFNSDNKIFDFLKFGNNLTLNHDIKSNGDYNIKNTMGALPTQTVRNTDGAFTNQLSNPEWYGGIDNPIGKAILNSNVTKGYNLIGSIYSELDIVKGLKFKSNFGLQLNIWDHRNWNPKHDWVALPQTLSSLYQQYNKSFTWLWDNTVTYSKLLAEKHSINFMVGTSAQANRYDFVGAFRQGFLTDETPVLNAGSEVGKNATGGGNEWSLFSYFGRANYSYDDKYLLTLTIRRDGSSKFGPSNKYGTFPSASVAWRVSKEGFIQNLTFINDLKIRAGYGETGNQEIGGNYPYATLLSLGNYNFNGTYVQTAYPLRMPNYQIHWESVKQTNLGFDASLLNSRIDFTIDAFVKNTTGMLVRGIVNITTGYDNQNEGNRPYVNAGKMQNQGVEFALSTKNLTGDFKWNTSFNLTFLQNKIQSLNDTVPIIAGSIDGNINLAAARQMNGHPFNAFYGYTMEGIFQTQEEVDNSSLQVAGATKAGDIKFKDLNHDGVVNDKDRTFIGNPNPGFIFSMNNTFEFKNFDFTIFLQGVYGNDIFNANRLQIEGMDAARNQSKNVLNRWNGEGTSTAMPRAVFGDPAQNNRISDRYIEDGSYLRVKNITLGYTVPKNIAAKAKMSSLRLYLSLQNLATLTKYTGIDPEVGINGIDNNVYPVTKTYSLGINLSF